MDLNIISAHDRGNQLLIVAETEFERSFCKTLEDKKFVASIKTGLTPADVVGIKLVEIEEQAGEN